MPIPLYLANALFSRTGRTRIASPSSSKISLSPGPTPKARRISRGTVICPLLVIFACFFNAFLISLLYHTSPYILAPGRHCALNALRLRHSQAPVQAYEVRRDLARLRLCLYCACLARSRICWRSSEVHMQRTLLIIIVVILLLGALPAWPYSAGWGYYPSGGLGLLLLILLILVLAKKL
jgi:Protein of unknown function (DUF3309)